MDVTVTAPIPPPPPPKFGASVLASRPFWAAIGGVVGMFVPKLAPLLALLGSAGPAPVPAQTPAATVPAPPIVLPAPVPTATVIPLPLPPVADPVGVWLDAAWASTVADVKAGKIPMDTDAIVDAILIQVGTAALTETNARLQGFVAKIRADLAAKRAKPSSAVGP